MENFPVIGICGPSQSGKDLVADWFCEKKGFAKVAFADPIKRFARQIFNSFDFETMWGKPEMREKPVTFSDDEWFNIFSNHSMSANLFLNEVVPEGFRVNGYLSLSEWLHEMRNLHTEAGHLTARVVLQTLGTEWGRKKVHPLLWCLYFHEKIAPRLGDGLHLYAQERGIWALETNDGKRAPGPKGIVIPDTRFLNEIEETKQRGGINVRIKRLSKEQEFKNDNVGVKGHQSEVEMREIPDSAFDHVLELEEGKDKVYAVLEKLWQEQERSWFKKGSSTSSTSESPTPTA